MRYFTLFIKGFGVGMANLIPGVSGGTIALLTGIFEELINSIKSFDIQAIKLLLKCRFREFSVKINFYFLLAVLGGAVVSIFTLASTLEFFFYTFPVYTWSYFFGLILASVFYVGRTIDKWTLPVILFFLAGTLVATGINYMNPASQNENFIYLALCGAVAVSSMILPGISGSFVLMLMGNYELIVIDGITNFRFDLLIPFGIGIIVGLVAFSHFLSWIYKKFRYQTIASLVGFILGSLVILWPWKNNVYKVDELGNPVLTKSGELIVQSFERFIPDSISQEVIVAFLIMLSGIFTIWGIEYLSGKKLVKKLK